MSIWFLSLIQFLVSSYFSTVPEILPQNVTPSVLLVDVRSPEEYAVSHIQGAVNLQKVEDVTQLVSKNPNRQVVIYCSVGVRSGIMARDVNKQNLSDRSSREIYNLKGGIFRWAIEGRALINSQGVARLVHGFGWPWKYLLPADLRSNGSMNAPD